ncbi:GmrSD restriction endonuclease domain-containing protein [Rhodocaloribacter sp.]
MRDVQKPDHVSLTTLIGRLREGRYVIPDFQREFEWKPWDIRDLMRSIFLDYYIGSLLLWKGKPENFDALACEPLYGFEGREEPTHIVLDGQQRLTAMHYAFMAPDVAAPHRKKRFLYFIRVDRFMEELYDDAFEYDWTQHGLNLLADRETQFEAHMFPLAVVGAGGWSLPNWVQEYEQHWRMREASAREAGAEEDARQAANHAKNARLFGEHLKGITEQYQVAYIELDRDLALDKVCDIFTQINSRGIRLDAFDLINALLKPKGLQLKHMWREASERLNFVATERMNVYILQVMSILRQTYCSPKYLYYLLPGQEKKVREPDGSLRTEVLVPDPPAFKELWHEAVAALERSIEVLRHPQEFGAISSQYLPYVSVLPAFAAIQVAARALPPNRQLEARRKLRHWYWASVFMNRYSGSVESTTARDYLDLKAWFEDDAAEPGLIGEFKVRFLNLDLRRETRRGTSVYNGIFNLLVLRGARDWMTGNVPQYGDLDDHHIVPKSWARVNKPETSVDTILNRTPLSSDTNRNVIGDRLPNAYLPELIAANGEATVRTTLETHFISPAAFDILLRDPFTVADYEAFLSERQRTLREAIEDLLVKERLDLPPRLRALDAEVEAVELALRRLVDEALDGDAGTLPPHVQRKVDERLRRAAKKNPALDADHYATLAGQLEFSDLRELQDTLLSKALWPRFSDRFRSKELLAKRFDQLAELRNGIRHSRTVDEVTRKEGEAALAWFREVLGL